MTLEHLVAEHVAGIRAYGAPGPSRGIKLDANESPWSLPEQVRKQLAERLAAVSFERYPDPDARELRALLPSVHGGAAADYVIGSGSDEVIALLSTALSAPRPGEARARVLYPTPTFVMFGITARAQGLEPVEVPLRDDWQLDVDAMRSAIETTAPNVVYLATPNNPTGNAYDEKAIRDVIETRTDVLVVLDEAYAAYAGRTLRALADEYPHVAMMGTISKVGFAAARVGWVRLPSGLAAQVDKARQPYNLNTLSQEVAILALTTLWPTIEDFVHRVVSERARLTTELTRRGVQVFPSQANLLLVRPVNAPALDSQLRSRGIHVKAFAEGRLAGHLRITVGTPEENDALLAAL